MKILVLGKNGQVGHALQAALPVVGSVIPRDRSEADLENQEALEAVLATVNADVIVNAAAYTAVDRAESEAARARLINTEAVGVIARHAARCSALLVHYSTDYVFDGESARPYLPTDPTAPQGEYGRSKLAGEQAIAASGCRALVLRTSWVFSAHGGNFIKTILRLAAERNSLKVVSDQYGAPTSARLIAEVTARAIPRALDGRMQPGVYHLTAAGYTTWHELACFVVQRAAANGAALKLKTSEIEAIPAEAYPLPAKRPKNSRMDTASLASALDMVLPDWRIDVARVVDELTLPKGDA